MKVFLSYASEDRDLAEEASLALTGAGHEVFFDKDSLPVGGEFHARIEKAVQAADALVFIISLNSLRTGSYALTELKLARAKWPHPKGRLVPVLVRGTPWSQIPAYLKSVTVLEPEGSLPAEVLNAVNALARLLSIEQSTPQPIAELDDPIRTTIRKASSRYITFGSLATLALLLTLLSATWIYFSEQPPKNSSSGMAPNSQSPSPSSTQMGSKGSDGARSDSPTVNTQCPEVTYTDYSKYPPESKIVRRCEP